MNRNDIFCRIKKVFEDFFDGEVEVNENTSMENCEEWESVSHIQLIFELEEEFEMEFEAEQIADMTSIKKIIDIIETEK